MRGCCVVFKWSPVYLFLTGLNMSYADGNTNVLILMNCSFLIPQHIECLILIS